MSVSIEPLPAAWRGKRFRPGPPPVFPAGQPTADEIELALALFAELDAESQGWLGGGAFVQRCQERMRALG